MTPPLSLSQIAAIEATARQATSQGPWHAGNIVSQAVFADDGKGPKGAKSRVATCESDENAKHIANLSPDVILSLCSMARPKTCATCRHSDDMGGDVRYCGGEVAGRKVPTWNLPIKQPYSCSFHEARQGQET